MATAEASTQISWPLQRTHLFAEEIAMMKESFQFKICEFDCISLCDGYHDYSIDTFFPNVDRRDLEQALRARDWPIDRVSSPYASLYVDTGEHHVLVDTGAGDFFPMSATPGNQRPRMREARTRASSACGSVWS